MASGSCCASAAALAAHSAYSACSCSRAALTLQHLAPIIQVVMCNDCMSFFYDGTEQLLRSPIRPGFQPRCGHDPCPIRFVVCDPCLLITSSSSPAAHLQQLHAAVAQRPTQRHLRRCPAPPPPGRPRAATPAAPAAASARPVSDPGPRCEAAFRHFSRFFGCNGGL